jgi:hypothetical protein
MMYNISVFRRIVAVLAKTFCVGVAAVVHTCADEDIVM